MKYVVLELQKYADGTVGHLIDKYDDLEHAYSKFFLILSSAALSNVPVHSAVIIDETGMAIQSRSFTHPQEAEPEGTE